PPQVYTDAFIKALLIRLDGSKATFVIFPWDSPHKRSKMFGYFQRRVRAQEGGRFRKVQFYDKRDGDRLVGEMDALYRYTGEVASWV
ncbi:hypothetical protein, partial [Fibrella forsythiae]